MNEVTRRFVHRFIVTAKGSAMRSVWSNSHQFADSGRARTQYNSRNLITELQTNINPDQEALAALQPALYTVRAPSVHRSQPTHSSTTLIHYVVPILPSTAPDLTARANSDTQRSDSLHEKPVLEFGVFVWLGALVSDSEDQVAIDLVPTLAVFQVLEPSLLERPPFVAVVIDIRMILKLPESGPSPTCAQSVQLLEFRYTCL
ncbi:hypothetical protein V8E53_000696 [Lactarius tabidus]